MIAAGLMFWQIVKFVKRRCEFSHPSWVFWRVWAEVCGHEAYMTRKMWKTRGFHGSSKCLKFEESSYTLNLHSCRGSRIDFWHSNRILDTRKKNWFFRFLNFFQKKTKSFKIAPVNPPVKKKNVGKFPYKMIKITIR